MIAEQPDTQGRISRSALLVMIMLAGGLMLAYLTGSTAGWLGAFYTVVLESAAAMAIVAAAGGFGWIIVRWICPPDAPRILRISTSCVIGLWMLSTALLVVGSLTDGLLVGWLWWPVIAAGLLLAGWFGRRGTQAHRAAARSDGRVLIWVLLAVVAGISLTGATHPPGWWAGVSEEYDVLEYHLQVPREFYEAGHIGELTHNVYSHYPLGVEMLYLLAMVLRGGAYEGMYLAKFLHLSFAGLAVAGIFGAFRDDDHARGRFAIGLLATTPIVVYLSWLAMVELAEVCCTALALLWLRHWTKYWSARSAICVGLMAGCACAAKYLSVGLVAGPVLLAMMLIGLKRLGRIWHLAPAALAALLLFSPWLIRNTINTRNPVFPLATTVFGRAHWSAESQRRWIDGHGPDFKPPVPAPPGYEAPQPPSRLVMFVDNFLSQERFGYITMVLAALGICVWIARSGPADLFSAGLIATVAAQLAVWTAFTHLMPPRFLVPAVVPLALLAAGALADLARVRRNPLRPDRPDPLHGSWGLAPAMVAFAAAVGVNLLICVAWYKLVGGALPPGYGLSGNKIAREVALWSDAYELPEGSQLLLVGDAKAFYFPPQTVYATAFDAHPLAELIDSHLPPGRIIEQLRGRGITHVWADWDEITRLAMTYGYPASLSSDLLRRRAGGGPVGTAAFERLGLRAVKHFQRPAPTTAPATAPADTAATKPAASSRPADTWPIFTIYELPAGAPAGG